MKLKLFGIVAILFLSLTALNAQQGQQQEIPDLNVEFMAGDLAFAIQQLNTVEITGREVDAFVQVKEHFMPTLKQLQEEQATQEKKVMVTIPVGIAQNFLVFLERAKLNGQNAERFVRIKQAIVDKAKEVQGSMNTNN
jgi:hypothetical protein